MNMTKVLYGSLLFLFLSSCDWNKEKIFVNYYLRYDQTASTVNAEVTFYKGDSLLTAVPLTVKNGVFFEEGAMSEKDLGNRGIFYRSERNGAAKPFYVYKYNLPELGKQEFKQYLPYINDFKFKDNTISKHEGISVTYDTKPLEQGETLVAVVTDSKNVSAQADIEGPQATTTLSFKRPDLINLENGKGKVYLVRKKTIKKAEGKQHQIIQTEYYSPMKEILIVE